MILDVGKSIVKPPSCIESPVLGQIPPEYLSGGKVFDSAIKNIKDS